MTTPTLLAEQACLGGLLLDPHPDVVRRLRPGDFLDPWHRDVFREIRGRALAGLPVDTHAVGLALRDRLGPTRADVVRLTRLWETTPARPDLPGYAAMVLEASLRREIAAQGLLLRAGALAAVIDRSPRPLLATAALIDATLASAEQRYRDGMTPPVSAVDREPRLIGGAVRPEVSRRRAGHRLLAADRFLGAHPTPRPGEVAEREAALIACLVTHPDAVGEVRAWLRPDAMINPRWRTVYTAVLRLADDGRPIDPVTATWAACQGATRCAPTADALLAAVEAQRARHPGYLARAVAAGHLQLRARAAESAVRRAAEAHDQDLPGILAVARTETVDVREAAAALRPAPQATPARPLGRLPNRPAPGRGIEGRAG